MPRSPGSRLGIYEITAPLGEGGMGAVYRARDTKLNRDVALKVLLPDVANDPERLARFRREAQVLASLNHPHIGAIHGLEESNGTIALVMELVEGEDLSQRITRGAIPLDEALPIARQIAEALEAAHEQTIVHRDLKPANIKVRPDGTVKVLDFGLAKAMDPAAPASGEAMQAPTITTPAMTQAGMILGTAAYMAPEQAKGRPVDKRADIWAFGAVLYEMLTGRRAFEGEDIADVLSRVLQREPDLAALPAATPPRLRELIARCLVKDPRRRLRDIGDARLDLESAIAAPIPDAAAPATTQASRAGYQLAWAVAGAAVLAAGAFAALWLGAPRAPAVARQARVEIVTPATTDPGSIALSPDGQHIAYIAADGSESMLWLRLLATGQAHVVKGTAGATLPFWSPDSRSIAFFAAGMLKRVDVEGTTVTDIGPAARPRGGTWHPEGGILYASSSVGSIWQVDPSGRTGQPRKPITELGPGQTGHVQPDWLPDGRHFVYRSSGTTDARGIWLGSTDGSPARRLVDADVARVLPPSTLLFVRQNMLLAQPLAAASATLTGEPLVVAPLEGGPVDGGLSISAHGSIAWRAGGRQQARYQWVDRSGRAEAQDGGADDDMDGARSAVPSPDGRFLAVDRTVDGNADVWIKDLARGVFTRLTVHADFDRFPTWTPDGKTIVFASTRDRARWDLYARAAGGSGEDERLLSTPRTKHPLEFSADGRLLLYEEWAQASEPALWTLQMSDRKPSALVSGARRGTFSPDGRWLAYESAASGRSEIYVQPYPGPGDRIQVSRDGGVHPRWRGDGRELYFVGLDRQLMAVPIGVPGDGSAVELGGPVPLFLTPLDVATGDRAEYLASRDGQRFFVRAVPGDGPQAPIHMILHWRPSPP